MARAGSARRRAVRKGSYDSLFSEGSSDASCEDAGYLDIDERRAARLSSASTAVARRIHGAGAVESVPGLFYVPSLLDDSEQRQLWDAIALSNMFCGGSKNQVMLFTAPPVPSPSPTISETSAPNASLPPFIVSLLARLPGLLRGKISEDAMRLLFEENRGLAWQVILNLYRPGEGIVAHVDLSERYADGIVGISLGAGTVMEFEEVAKGDEVAEQKRGEESKPEKRGKEAIWLEEGSAIVLTGPARWEWTHGIPVRTEDLVRDPSEDGGEVRRVLRTRTRVSATMRRMAEGAEVLR